MPTVHFLCKHSFHQRCLNQGARDEKLECPVCAKQNATIRAIRKAQTEASERHEMFREALGRGGWAVVGEFFGRGVMGGGAGVE